MALVARLDGSVNMLRWSSQAVNWTERLLEVISNTLLMILRKLARSLIDTRLRNLSLSTMHSASLSTSSRLEQQTMNWKTIFRSYNREWKQAICQFHQRISQRELKRTTRRMIKRLKMTMVTVTIQILMTTATVTLSQVAIFSSKSSTFRMLRLQRLSASLKSNPRNPNLSSRNSQSLSRAKSRHHLHKSNPSSRTQWLMTLVPPPLPHRRRRCVKEKSLSPRSSTRSSSRHSKRWFLTIHKALQHTKPINKKLAQRHLIWKD